MLEKQDGACAICGGTNKDRNYHIDHCHDTGEVRGLLCYLCNISLGGFNDSVDLLERAKTYLLKFMKENSSG